MKHNAMTPFILAFAVSALGLITSPLSLAVESNNKAKEDRWFEIEVILFKQATKNSEHAEEFFPRDLNYKKQRALDLLASYLQPDIKILKQLLPSCDQAEATELHSTYNVTIPPQTIWLNSFENDDVSTSPVNIDNTDNTDDTNNHIAYGTENDATHVINTDSSNATATLSPIIADESQTPFNIPVSVTPKVSFSQTQNFDRQQSETALSDAQPTEVLLTDNSVDNSVDDSVDNSINDSVENSVNGSVDEYQVKYANIELEIYNQYPTNIDKGICIIPSEIVMRQLSAEQLKDFNIDGFPVERQAKTINGVEQWQDDENGEITWASDSSYLISQDSLRLKSIANRIKRSRNYESLLHLGWRQVGENRRRAKAVRLYAGENLALDYQQALATQNEEQQAIARQAILEQEKEEQLALIFNNKQLFVTDSIFENNQQILETDKTILSEDNNALIREDIEEKVRQHALQQQLNNIFEQYSVLADLEQESDKLSDDSSKSNHLPNHSSSQSDSFPPHKSRYNDADVKRIIDELSADITEPNPSLVLNSNTTEAKIKTPIQPWYLDGLFKVHLDHYLYINSEFNILDTNKKPYSTLKNIKESEQNNIITFKQDRRVISGEVHYFDHPHMGMIVQIRRFDPTKPAAEAVSQSKK